MDSKKGIYWRVYVVYLGFLLLMTLVLYKTAALQMEGRSEVFSANNGVQEKMPTRTVQRVPRRGEILDANYKQLVTSVSFYDIHMDPSVVDKELFDAEVNGLAQGLFELFPDKTASEW